jgi:endonuclease/exonuclease/phosphatase family metal-dependent hydrolase
MKIVNISAAVALIMAWLVSPVIATPIAIRVVTWNLQWFPGGKNATRESQDRHIALVREEIRKLNPDILILQEVGSAQALDETLKPLDSHWQTVVISAFKQGGLISGQQIAIAAKIPAESAWAEPWNRGWADAPRGYAYALFPVNGKKLAIYGLHLKSNLGDAAENTSKREDAVQQLIQHVELDNNRVTKAEAIVVGGDFNTDDPDAVSSKTKGERTFDFFRKAGFSWAYEGIDFKNRITCPAKDRYPAACFDHFWTRGLSLSSAQAFQSSASDHFPVVMEIAL